MTDSMVVLNLLKVVYTIYAVFIISLIGWFGYRLTLQGRSSRAFIKPAYFYSYIFVLIFIGVSIHILTFNKIPWVRLDLTRHEIIPDQTFHIEVKDHKFSLPEEKLVIPCGNLVKFDVVSKDRTYGFGLFRDNQTMVFQMQVNPGSRNDIVWQFHKNEAYSIRSTEYSGPRGADMFLKDAVEVVGCGEKPVQYSKL